MNPKRGRPRNMETRQAILNASYELLLEQGFAQVTVDKIAERAGVSKATIYKWWPNKAGVVLDGFLSAASARLPVPDMGSVRRDMSAHAVNLACFLSSPEGKVITELVGGSQFDPALAEECRSRYFSPRRQEATGLLKRGVDRGELSPDSDLEQMVDMIYGPIFYRLLITGGSLDEIAVHRLIHMAFEGIQPQE